MRLGRIAALAAATAVLSFGVGGVLASEAMADVTEVGGGAAGLIAIVNARDTSIFPEVANDPYVEGYSVVLSEPRVVLPKRGSPGRTAVLAGADAGGVSAGAIRVTTRGNLRGTPYAESSAGVGDVVVPGLDVSALRAECRWDEANGATATTSVVKANGAVYTPEPNTRIELPGLGRVWLNEQFTNVFDGREVISVHALRLELDDSIAINHDFLGDPYDDDDLEITPGVILGFASCDPFRLPPISAVKTIVTAA